MSDYFDPCEPGMDTPYDIVERASVESTQDVASDLFGSTATPTLVVAGRQTAGRGRQGREWAQPDEAVFSSFAFQNQWSPAALPLVPLCTAVAVRRSLLGHLGVAPALKWPNDLLVAGLKVGGILVESSADVVVVGCGLNLRWREPPAGAGALSNDSHESGVAKEIARTWVDELLGIVAAGPSLWPRDEYVANSATLGEPVEWENGSGMAVGLGDAGSLLVATDDGDIELVSGDVHLRSHR